MRIRIEVQVNDWRPQPALWLRYIWLAATRRAHQGQALGLVVEVGDTEGRRDL